MLYLPEAPAEAVDLRFNQVIHLLRPNDLLVLNNSKVIRARLFGNKVNGGKVEILIERIFDEKHASAQVKASKTPNVNTIVKVGGVPLLVLSRNRNLFRLAIHNTENMTFEQLLEENGNVPLPPYIRRPAEWIDHERYQTVYAKYSGSVAAPTAGLHFDHALLDECRRQGVQVRSLTLHIGLGTFQPIRHHRLDAHTMHRESFVIDQALCSAVYECRARGGRVVAVGSTVVRALETVAQMNDGQLHAYQGETDIFIRPGYSFQVVDSMITNFHLPESTLFILVCAFAGKKRMLDAYHYAIAQRYRFYSYGDVMWLEKNAEVHA